MSQDRALAAAQVVAGFQGSRAAGFDAHLVKPIAIATVTSTLAELLA